MSITIIGSFDPNTQYCTGSFTKLLTTFVSLSFLAEQYDLYQILDDNEFLNHLVKTPEAKDFLQLFQNKLGGKFSIHDLCSYYTGLPYTFDVSMQVIERVDKGELFKHHSILDKNTFLDRCRNDIIPVYPIQSKFNYSELSIVFLAYMIEKIFDLKIESLFDQYMIECYQLTNSKFSRTRLSTAYVQDLSDIYDYPAIALQDHGYFCYSNGFYTTLNDTKTLLENLISNSVFQIMTDIKLARAASNRLMNGLTIEMRKANDDIIFGYEGLSYSGCNNWAYSTKTKKGYLTFTNTEEKAYDIIFDMFGHKDFDKVPAETETIYRDYLNKYKPDYTLKNIPTEFQGHYQRVDINTKHLDTVFTVRQNDITIRNPEEINYELVFANNHYHIKTKDNMPGEAVCFKTAESGNRYMTFSGNLYKKVAA